MLHLVIPLCASIFELQTVWWSLSTDVDLMLGGFIAGNGVICDLTVL